MSGRQRTSWLVAVVLIGMAVAACTGPRPAGTLPSTPISITDFKTVAGVWEGILEGRPGSASRTDWIMMEIGADGSYSFATFRQIGVFQGSGTLRLSDGRLFLQGPEGGSATFTLYEGDGRRMLSADALTRGGARLTANLTPKR